MRHSPVSCLGQAFVLAAALTVTCSTQPALGTTTGGKGGAGVQLRQRLGQALARRLEPGGAGSGMGPRAGGAADGSTTTTRGPEMVPLEAVASASAPALLRELQRLGLRNGVAAGRLVSGLLPLSALEAAAGLEQLAFARDWSLQTSAGSVNSQGELSLGAAAARLSYGVDGTGIEVFILSDSFDCSGTGLASDVASGDLPAGVMIIDDSGCPASDEGRALAQVVHDIAPGAALSFRTASLGQADLATALLDLAEQRGARVILLDVSYLSEPYFQDGVLAQAVQAATAAGAFVVTAAGNLGRGAYAGPLRPSGISVLFDGDAHDFDPGPGVDVYQRVSIPVDGTARLSLQWDEPFFSVSGAPGSANDLDICLMDDPPVIQLACGSDFNVGADPLEVLTFQNDGTFGTTFNLVIEHFDGPQPGHLRYLSFSGDMQVLEFAAPGATLFGHAQAEGAFSVAAAFYDDTPAYGTSPALASAASSRGGMPILFDPLGGRLPAPALRQQPRATAPDGVNNTFFGVDIPDPGDKSDKDTRPNFFGTSASAAHAAGLAALLLHRNGALTPADLGEALAATAADMDDPDTAGFDTGYDVASGLGLLSAAAALAAVPECGNGVVEPPELCDDGNTVDDDACGNDCLVNICGDGVVHPGLGEECDDGNSEPDDFCRNECIWNRCGDGRTTSVWGSLIVNGNFESGSLQGWTLRNMGAGTFQPAVPGADTPVSHFPTSAFADGGSFYAITDQTDSGTHALEQAFTVPPTCNRLSLAFDMYVNDLSNLGGVIDPIGLDHTGPRNQHSRVDILAPEAAPFDTGSGVMVNLYLGVDQGPSPHPFQPYAFDLTDVVGPGGSGRLRFAEVDNQYFQHLGLDNVSLLAGLLEQCDDGNLADGDGCSAACEIEGCPLPAEVQGLSFAADGITLTWPAEPGRLYDLVRGGDAATYHDPEGAAGVCLASGSGDSSAIDIDNPVAGTVFSYLVRSRNACGPGSWGRDGSGLQERRAPACP